MISLLVCNTFVCERYGHLNGTHYSKIALFLSRPGAIPNPESESKDESESESGFDSGFGFMCSGIGFGVGIV